MSSSNDSGSVNHTKEHDQPDAAERGPVSYEKEGSHTTEKLPSVTRIPHHVGNLAAEKLKAAKDGAVPAVAGAIQTAQDQMRSIAGQTEKSSDQENTATPDERESIEQMDSQRVCDFLREKHMSNEPLPRKN